MGLMPKLVWHLRHRVFSSAYIRFLVFLLLCVWCGVVGMHGYARYVAAQKYAILEDRSQVDDVDAFYLSFAKQSELAEILGRIHDAAPRHGLVLPEGDLRVELVSDSKNLVVQTVDKSLYRYSVSVVLKGEVRSVAAYVADVMRVDVGVALVSLTFVDDGKNSANSEYLLGFEVYVSDNADSAQSTARLSEAAGRVN